MTPAQPTDTVDLKGKFEFDYSRWPVFVITQQVEQVTDAERYASLVEADRILDARPGRYCLVLNNCAAGPVPASQRKMIAEHMSEHSARARARCRSTAFVFDSPVMRGVLTAIFWMRKPEVETRVFADVKRAVEWCQQCLFSATEADRTT